MRLKTTHLFCSFKIETSKYNEFCVSFQFASPKQTTSTALTMHIRAIETLDWTPEEVLAGKTVKVKKFASETRLKLLRVTVSTNRTDYIATNDLTQSDTDAAQKASGLRWKIEQFHREAKQITGIEDCQCRLNRSQRNHIASALLVWVVFKELADKTAQTVYQLKHGFLSDYLKQQLRNAAIAFS